MRFRLPLLLLTAGLLSASAAVASPATAGTAPTPVADRSSIPRVAIDDPGSDSAGTVLEVGAGVDLGRVAAEAAARVGVDVSEVTVVEEIGMVAVPGADPTELAGIAGVVGAEEDPVAHATAITPDDPLYTQYQWGLTASGVDDAWVRTTGSSDVVVAVVDTGVSAVSELTGALLPGYDFVNDDSDPTDDNGHGTESATVIAARSNNGVGMAGICWACSILPVKVLGADGTGAYSAVAAGIVYAADQGADIINLSLGGTTPAAILDEAVAYARQSGALVLAAAGNNGLDEAFYPAASPGAFSVAGHDALGVRYEWSNFGTSRVDISAPGCNVAQSSDGGYYWYCGTSSATPFVSGVAALALSARPALTAQEMITAMTGTAVPNDFTRYGRIDAEGLLFEHPLVDAAAPSVSFVSPLPGRTVTGSVEVTATPVDDVSIARVDLWVGDAFAGSATAEPWTVSFSTEEYPSGATTLKWRAHDRAGNVGVVERTVVIDNAAPTATFSWPYPSQPVRGQVTVIADVGDDAGVVRADLYLGSTRLGSAYAAPWQVTVDTSVLDEGSKTLRWRVHDRAGNTTVVSRNVVVDRSAPSAAVVWPNPGRVVRGTIGVTTNLTDNVGVVETSLLVNEEVVSTHAGAPTTITWNTGNWAGRTEVQLRATDRAGNVRWSPIRVVTVDNEAPTLSISSPRPGEEITGEVVVEGVASDATGIARVELWVGGQLVDTTSSASFSLTWDSTGSSGPTAIKVVAVDLVRNRMPFTRTVIVQ